MLVHVLVSVQICAPLLANYRYMKSLIKNNLQLAKRFNCTMRHIDDLLTLNITKFACAIPEYISS